MIVSFAFRMLLARYKDMGDSFLEVQLGAKTLNLSYSPFSPLSTVCLHPFSLLNPFLIPLFVLSFDSSSCLLSIVLPDIFSFLVQWWSDWSGWYGFDRTTFFRILNGHNNSNQTTFF